MTQKQILHPSDRLPQPAVETLNFQQGRFLITKEELNFRIQTFLMDLERIREFARFAVANNNKFNCGDVRIFSGFMQEFLNKEFVNSQKILAGACRQYPFELLLLCDLCRET